MKKIALLFFFFLYFISVLFSSEKFSTILENHLNHFNPPWMRERLEKDFSSFNDQSLTHTKLTEFERSITTKNEYARVCIDNNFVTIKPFQHSMILIKPETYDRVRKFLAALKKIKTLKKLPSMEFIMFFGDGLHHDSLVPVLCFAKKAGSKNLILIPDFETLTGLGHYYTILKQNDIPYKNKKDLAFWRGATTGGNFTLSNWKNFPRSKAVIFSLKNPQILDAKFTNIVAQDKKLLEQHLKSQCAVTKMTPVKDHLSYKFLPDIDGNSCSYSRLHWILYSNSLCLKQMSDLEQWYYGGLKPYIHFIPFKEDMSDFETVTYWAKNHENECETIVKNATAFAQNNLTIYPTLTYLYRVLLKYASLQKL